MKTKLTSPQKEYPYLAIWVGRDFNNEDIDPDSITSENILVISKLLVEENDKERLSIYVQNLTGGHEGYLTKNEEEYIALPSGYTVEIIQK